VGALWNHYNDVVDVSKPAGVFGDERFLAFLKQHNIRVILLERTNGLAHLLSSSNTKFNTATMGTLTTQRAPTLHSVRLPKARLQGHYMEWAVRHNQYLLAREHMTRAGIQFAYVTYEWLLHHPETFEALWHFIGLRHKLDEQTSKKLLEGKWHTHPPAAYLVNADQVKHWLQQTPQWKECVLSETCEQRKPVFNTGDALLAPASPPSGTSGQAHHGNPLSRIFWRSRAQAGKLFPGSASYFPTGARARRP
jgi:hypothetical protein